MPTATDNGWKKYERQYLAPGDEITMSHFSRKLAGKKGVVVKMLQKNVSVIIDGVDWRVSPSLIDRFRAGDASKIQEAKNEASVKCNPAGLRDCKVGDVLLMFRGSFDVVQLKNLKSLSCQVIGGRQSGRSYCYKPDMFVQKLDKACFSG